MTREARDVRERRDVDRDVDRLDFHLVSPVLPVSRDYPWCVLFLSQPAGRRSSRVPTESSYSLFEDVPITTVQWCQFHEVQEVASALRRFHLTDPKGMHGVDPFDAGDLVVQDLPGMQSRIHCGYRHQRPGGR